MGDERIEWWLGYGPNTSLCPGFHLYGVRWARSDQSAGHAKPYGIAADDLQKHLSKATLSFSKLSEVAEGGGVWTNRVKA